METVEAIERVVARLRWRLRAQAALRHGLLLGAIGLFVFALLVVLVKARALPTDWVWIGGGLAIALPLIGIALGLVSRLDDIALATALDASGGLHSRLGSALAFARLSEPTAMQRAAMADALTVLERARPQTTAPWRWGVFVGGVVALAVALAVTMPALFVFEMPVGSSRGAVLARVQVPPPFQRDRLTVRETDAAKLEELAKDLEEEVEAAANPEVKAFLDELNELIRALQEGRITAEEAHARLASLDKELAEWKAEHQRGAEEALERLAEAAAQLKRKSHDALEPVMEALERQALEDAARALEELRAKLADEELRDRDIEKIAKGLEKLAEAIQSERQQERERLRKERERLKKKEERLEDRMSKRDRERLKKNERRLEQLDDPDRRQEMSQPERQLERLSEELDQAAADLMRRLSQGLDQLAGQQGPQSEQRREQPGQEGQDGQSGGQPGGQQMSREQLERVVEALERMAKDGQGREQMRAAQRRMIDVGEMMRRGQQGDGQGKDGKGGQPGSEGGQQAGKDGEGGSERGTPGPGEGEDGAIMLGQGEGGQGGEMLLLGPQGGRRVPAPGRGQGSAEAVLGQDGAGDGHDPNLFRERTGLDDYTVNPDFVPGQEGDGPSKTRVIMTAAEKGFATRSYRDVHQDYSGVVEDALEKEQIPPGKRTYVRRYFDLIRPR